ncbi:MAG: HAD-IA family hydrolase [Desulfobacterales bacterium]
MRIEVVVFDYNGTLVDDLPLVIASYHRAIREAGFAVAKPEIVRAVSLSPAAKRRALLGDAVSTAQWEKILGRRRQIYREFVAEGLPLFPDTAPVLEALARRFRLGLVSNTFRELFEACFPPELARLFESCLFFEEAPQPKPSPQALRSLLGRMAAAAERAAFVGDAVEDMAMARAAGVRGIGVTTGCCSAEELYAAGASAVETSLTGCARRLLEEREQA